MKKLSAEIKFDLFAIVLLYLSGYGIKGIIFFLIAYNFILYVNRKEVEKTVKKFDKYFKENENL
jgi:hypothetical protein